MHGHSRGRTTIVALMLGALVCTGSAEAQRTGGRFGGSSSFRSSSSSSPSRSYSSSSSSGSGRSWSSGSSSGSSFRWGSSSSRSSSRSSYRSSSSGGYDPPSDGRPLDTRNARKLLFALIAVVILAAAVHYSLKRNSASPAADGEQFEVRRLSVGLDWTVRDAVQAALDQAATEADPSTDAGRRLALGRVRDLLRGYLQGVRYAAFITHTDSPEKAQERFETTAATLNARYDHATLSNQRRVEPPEVTARREEGEGFVVVSIVVATDKPLPPLATWPTREAIDGALITIVPKEPIALVGLEVVWSPSIDQDRLSSAELEMLYPELVRVGATLPGRVVCRYCRCVSAQELGECPSCGSHDRVAPPSAAATPSSQGEGVSSANTIACPRCRQPVAFYEVQCPHCATRLRA